MKIGVVGSRTFEEYDFLSSNLSAIIESLLIDIKEITIVSGGSRGADELAEWFAKRHGIDTVIYKPDWNKHGKSAGFIRNQQIVDDSDILVVFWNGTSRGSLDSINKAKKKGIPVYIIRFEIWFWGRFGFDWAMIYKFHLEVGLADSLKLDWNKNDNDVNHFVLSSFDLEDESNVTDHELALAA